MSHSRHSIRLQGYDYSQSGLYFVTICTKNRDCLFGDVIDKKMVLNKIGKIIEKLWLKIPEYFDTVGLDVYQIMPNHVHGIIIIKPKSIVGVSFMKPTQPTKPKIQLEIAKSNYHTGLINRETGLMNQTPTLGQIVRYFKSKCTYEIHKNGFNNTIWQRNYYEHIIGTELDLHKIRIYISENPIHWNQDSNNPIHTKIE